MTSAEFQEKFFQQFETLPERLGGHIGLSLAALAAGICISVPLGIYVAKRPTLEKFVMMIASIIQTIPSLALLALMVFLFKSIGWIPACIALILYSILPMLRNTITGIQGIDPAYLEAAQGIGMDAKQTLFSVQLPLALPSIVSGIRTASVWVVGAATLAQPVGATSLGNYIFVGLQTWNIVAMLFGCLFSALLAIAFDSLLHGMEIAASKRSWRLASLIGSLVLLLAISPFILSIFGVKDITVVAKKSGDSQTTNEKIEPFVIASKNFSESYILMKLIEKRLNAEGLPVKTKDGMGSSIVFNALKAGEVDCYVDYTGTIWSNYMKKKEVTSPSEILVDVASFLKSEYGVISLGPIGFSNDYVFTMRKEDAESLKITTLFDLAKHAPNLRCAADIEFFGRPEWYNIMQAYGISFKESKTMEPTLMYPALENKNVEVIVAFRTDGRIRNLAVVEDPKQILPPYDGVLLVSRRMARNSQAMKALRPLVESISTVRMRQANAEVDIDEKRIADVSQTLFDELSKTEKQE